MHGNDGVSLIMGDAGFISSTVVGPPSALADSTALQVLFLICRIIATGTSSSKLSRNQLSRGLNDNTKSLRGSMALNILPHDLGKGRG